MLLPALLDPSDRPALRFPDGALTYPELARAAGALAARLPAAGRVAVVATPTVHTVVAVTAALLAGVPAVPLNPRLGQRESGHVLADAAPDVLLTAPGAVVPGRMADLPRLDVDLAGVGPTGAVVPGPEPDPEAPALIVYTSGTTGPPKGAVLSRRAVAANTDALAEAWEWTGDDVVAHALPLFHVHGLVLGVLGVLRRGGTLHHLGVLSAANLAAAVGAGATMVFGVPTQYHRLADELAVDADTAAVVGRARLLVSGSAALTAVDHARLLRSTGLAVRERYGLTETLILTAARASDEPEPGTVGRALTGTEVRLAPLPADGGEPADGAGLGTVEARGPGLFSGYLNLPDAMTSDGWFATGDIARWTGSGSLAIVGRRATDLIKSGGYKIGAGEIENALSAHPDVAECAVIGVPDDDLGERVVAYVVAGREVAPRVLVDHVAALLAPHKRPREVRFVEALPRNDMGKVVKSRLPR
jgi:malonyl-CoA/methylmalonyl-CoA synthetase